MPRSGKLNRFIDCPLEDGGQATCACPPGTTLGGGGRRGRRNGAGAFALALILTALTLTLAGVLASAGVLVLLRSAGALALALVLAANALTLTTVQAFTSVLVGSHLDGLRLGIVERERVRLRLVGTQVGTGAE